MVGGRKKEVGETRLEKGGWRNNVGERRLFKIGRESESIRTVSKFQLGHNDGRVEQKWDESLLEVQVVRSLHFTRHAEKSNRCRQG